MIREILRDAAKSASSAKKANKKLQAGEGTGADAKNEDGGAKKVKRKKAPPRPKLPPTTSPQTPTPTGHPVEECDIKELKSSSVLENNNEQKTSSNVDTSASTRRKSRKKRKTKRFPKELNLSSTSSEEERPLKSNSAARSKTTPVKVCEGGTTKVSEKVDVEEKVPSPVGRRRKRRGIKKAVKKLNPFGARRDQKTDLPSSKDCKEPEMKKGVVPSATEQELGEETSISSGGLSVVTVMLKEKPVISKTEVHDGASGGDERLAASEADKCGAVDSGGSASDQREDAATDTVKTAETDAVAATEKEKEKLACFFNKLLKPVPHKGEIMTRILTIVSQDFTEHCSEDIHGLPFFLLEALVIWLYVKKARSWNKSLSVKLMKTLYIPALCKVQKIGRLSRIADIKAWPL